MMVLNKRIVVDEIHIICRTVVIVVCCRSSAVLGSRDRLETLCDISKCIHAFSSAASVITKSQLVHFSAGVFKTHVIAALLRWKSTEN